MRTKASQTDRLPWLDRDAKSAVFNEELKVAVLWRWLNLLYSIEFSIAYILEMIEQQPSEVCQSKLQQNCTIIRHLAANDDEEPERKRTTELSEQCQVEKSATYVIHFIYVVEKRCLADPSRGTSRRVINKIKGRWCAW